MKKTFLIFSSCAMLLFSCTKTDVQDGRLADEGPVTPAASITARSCASQEVLAMQLKTDPTLAGRMQAIEDATELYAKNPSAFRLSPSGTIIIPVVVNVVYKLASENISAAQIQSQIDVLNRDFAGTNADITSVPQVFQGVKAGDVGVSFVLFLARKTLTKKNSFGTNDAMKSSKLGGQDPLDPTTKLNMWSCNMSGGILGYAQFPGGNPATDGVVIDNNAFGVTTNYYPYDMGRTATHEVGHWLNLRHIWGDATCGNDLVGDTPLHTGANFGCPVDGITSTCTGRPVMMTMNYMDYSDDRCLYMFSAGQKTRMNATFISGGGRFSFAQL